MIMIARMRILVEDTDTSKKKKTVRIENVRILVDPQACLFSGCGGGPGNRAYRAVAKMFSRTGTTDHGDLAAF